MHKEIIYTRCRNGIDLLNSGRPVTTDGFKVYACTSTLLKNDIIDLPFLFNAAQGKLPHKDPAFMDDAYLYLVPDYGEAFMLSFHPIPFNQNARGDFSHRAGNFVNQILIGDYSSFYASELFGDKTAWYAKERNEAYYYETPPTELQARKIGNNSHGKYTAEKLASFIADGRQKALRLAVSFLFEQFGLEAENRKFLVIRDESAEHIEMWIAAIQHAFSPRIAASIPFATRMEKLKSANRYTVNQEGLYQTQINLQDPSQKQRLRAMIVGVDERDSSNISAARPLANAAFVVLDGNTKELSVDTDISHPYFRRITMFSEDHFTFCREFLQMFDIKVPSTDILQLEEIYTSLMSSQSLPNANVTSNILGFLGRFNIFNTPMLRKFYDRIKAGLPHFLQESPVSAFQITQWLQKTARILGDLSEAEQLTQTVSDVFADQVFKSSDTKKTFSLWESIKNSGLASPVANYITSVETHEKYIPWLEKRSASDMITYVLIYIECSRFSDNVKMQDLQMIVKLGLSQCFQINDNLNAHKILAVLPQKNWASTQDMLLSMTKGQNEAYTKSTVNLILDYDKSIVSSDDTMTVFLEKLRMHGLENSLALVLQHRTHTLSSPSDVIRFVRMIKKIDSLQQQDLNDIFRSIDSTLDFRNKNHTSIAITLQQEKPQTAICPKSAHLYALEVLKDRRNRAQFINTYHYLTPQGFPSDKNPEYITALTDNLFKVKLNREEINFVIRLLSSTPEYAGELVRKVIDITSPKKPEEWYYLIAVASIIQSNTLNNAIIQECGQLKRGEKAIDQLVEILPKPEQAYFKPLADISRRIMQSQKSKSGVKKLFEWLKRLIGK